MGPHSRRLLLLLAMAAGLHVASPAASASIEYRGANIHFWYTNGQCTNLSGTTPDLTISGDLDRLRNASANSLRVDVAWSALEPAAKGQYDAGFLAKLDCLVDGSAARGIKPLLTLFETPCWASTAPEPASQICQGAYWDRGVTRYEPRNYDDYRDAARSLASRYGAKLAGIEVWNEPNYASNLRSTDPARTPADMMVSLTRAAWTGVKASTSPSTKVVTGAIEGADVDFLRQMYGSPNRLSGYFDLVSFHPYVGPHSPYWNRPAGWTAKNDFKGGIPAMRDVMVANGDAAKNVFLSEFGWSTCSDGDYSCVPCASAVHDCLESPSPTAAQREAGQAGFVRQAFQVASSFPYVEGATLYELRDQSLANCRECQYGVVGAQGTPKLGFAALGQASRSVAPGFTPTYGSRVQNTAGLVSHYRFGEAAGATTATDAKGGRIGNYTGGVKLGEFGAILGDPDRSALFDGSGHMSVPDSPALRLDGFTIEFEIAPEGWGDKASYRRVLSKGTAYAGRNYLIALKGGTTSKLFASVGTGTGEVALTSSADLAPQVWTHVAFVRDPVAGRILLYIDGKLDQSAPGPHAAADGRVEPPGRRRSGRDLQPRAPGRAGHLRPATRGGPDQGPLRRRQRLDGRRGAGRPRGADRDGGRPARGAALDGEHGTRSRRLPDLPPGRRRDLADDADRDGGRRYDRLHADGPRQWHRRQLPRDGCGRRGQSERAVGRRHGDPAGRRRAHGAHRRVPHGRRSQG